MASKSLPLVVLLFLFLFLLFHQNKISAASSTYTPVENFTIDCGSSGSTLVNGRRWAGDVNPSFLPTEVELRTGSSIYTQGGSVGDVPYTTARASRSEFGYQFRVSPGRKFLRLYFQPAQYAGFEGSAAFFSVRAGQYTLLDNFTAASVDKDKGLEFCLHVREGQSFDVTFAPSRTAYGDSYAFVNGVELVSMPDDLLADTNVPVLAPPGASSPLIDVDNQTALENVFRLNVGGQALPPESDTGMYRFWDDDNKFIRTDSSTPNDGYVNESTYFAPDKVYKTCRYMIGNDAEENKRRNLTWVLPVASGFMYLVRLHFCEIDPKVTKDGERTFEIYINNQIAEQFVDIFGMRHGNGLPAHKNYAVLVEGEGADGRTSDLWNLSIDLHPLSSAPLVDPFLNGLEVFKLNRSDGSLAVSDPYPPRVTFSTVTESNSTASKVRKVVAISVSASVAGVFVSAFAFLACYIILSRRRRRKELKPVDGALSPSRSKKVNFLPEDLCRRFSLAEMRAATDDFDERLVVGVGGFGRVYRGCIGGAAVAVKRLLPASGQGAREFAAEIMTLSRLRHVHLVTLVGYCDDGGEMILVYDFMANGNLRDHLYGLRNQQPLSWIQRLRVCIGAARSLHYLHAEAGTAAVIHRDVKSTNILLGEGWIAKVSDFGLSKTGAVAAAATAVKGSLGYLDPEYARGHPPSEKSDVYSFGVVLFEVLCARKPIDRGLPRAMVSLTHWARKCVEKGLIHEIVDRRLRGQISPECLRAFVQLAANCVREEGSQRPSMKDVMEGLEFALQLQEVADAAAEALHQGRNLHDKCLDGGAGENSPAVSVGWLSYTSSGSSGKAFSESTVSNSDNHVALRDGSG